MLTLEQIENTNMNKKQAMTDAERRFAAKQFAADWQGRGDEKQETQTFWLALLQKVYGVSEPDKFISFEKTVNEDNRYRQAHSLSRC